MTPPDMKLQGFGVGDDRKLRPAIAVAAAPSGEAPLDVGQLRPSGIREAQHAHAAEVGRRALRRPLPGTEGETVGGPRRHRRRGHEQQGGSGAEARAACGEQHPKAWWQCHA